MKQISIWTISVFCIFAISTACADDGEVIFKSQGCMSCHKKESTSKVKPPVMLEPTVSIALHGSERRVRRCPITSRTPSGILRSTTLGSPTHSPSSRRMAWISIR